MLRISSLILGGFVIVVTILPFFRAKAWWVRVWDFPRFQLVVLGTLALAGVLVANRGALSPPSWLFVAALGAAVLFQATLVWRYSRLAPLEVERNESDTQPRLSVAVSNVLQTNRDADRLIRVLTEADADVMLFVETDDWWRARLDVLLRTHPHTVQRPLSNTYGMLLYSRLPLSDTSIDFLVEPDIPSIQAHVQLADDATGVAELRAPPPAGAG